MGKAEEADGSGYLKWRVEEESPRMRWFGRAVAIPGWTALNVPHFFRGNTTILYVCLIAAGALLVVGMAIGLSKIHSY